MSPRARFTQAVLGSYTEPGKPGSCDGPGVAVYGLDGDGLLTKELRRSSGVRNPSFVVFGGGHVLAVEELDQGTVVALDAQTLELVGRVGTQGGDPCHLVHHDGSVWAANYGSGTAAVIEDQALFSGSGDLADQAESPGTAAAVVLLSHPGSGPVSDRQEHSHDHQITPTPWGTVLVNDLGADRIDEYAPSATGHERVDSAQLPPGTGPRHLVLAGNYMVVTGELDGQIHVLRRVAAPEPESGSAWQWLFRTPAWSGRRFPESVDAPPQPSHVELSEDGTLLYTAVRGPNTLAVFDISRLADGVEPELLAESGCGGNWPRHFILGERKLYVTNVKSNQVCVFDLDDRGYFGANPVQSVSVGSPTCLVLR